MVNFHPKWSNMTSLFSQIFKMFLLRQENLSHFRVDKRWGQFSIGRTGDKLLYQRDWKKGNECVQHCVTLFMATDQTNIQCQCFQSMLQKGFCPFFLQVPETLGMMNRVTRWFSKNCPIFWKVAQTVAKQNNTKLETIF